MAQRLRSLEQHPRPDSRPHPPGSARGVRRRPPRPSLLPRRFARDGLVALTASGNRGHRHHHQRAAPGRIPSSPTSRGGGRARAARASPRHQSRRRAQHPPSDRDGRGSPPRADGPVAVHSVSRAPKATAFLSISRSRRRIWFLLRSRPGSSRSAVVSPPGGPRPASLSTRFIQPRSAHSETPRSQAGYGMPLPFVRASSTASARKAAGYGGCVLAMLHALLRPSAPVFECPHSGVKPTSGGYGRGGLCGGGTTSSCACPRYPVAGAVASLPRTPP